MSDTVKLQNASLLAASQADTIADLTAAMKVVEKERDEWKRSAELVARVLIDTKSDLAAAMKVVEAGRYFRATGDPDQIYEALSNFGEKSLSAMEDKDDTQDR